jgi:Family of unknown function (DUF6130)
MPGRINHCRSGCVSGAGHHRPPGCCVSRCANCQGGAWGSGGGAGSKRTTGEDHHRSVSCRTPVACRVVIQYRTENPPIVPVFRPAALAVSLRVGHIHLTVDDAAWAWSDASGEPVILNGQPPGLHKILIQLETTNHPLLDQGVVKFTVPAAKPQPEAQ